VSQEPNEADQRHLKGGKAAERLREFLAARFGDKAPPIPPDELPSDEELSDEVASVDPPDEAGAPPTPRQSR
jgi:hypothetical protein